MVMPNHLRRPPCARPLVARRVRPVPPCAPEARSPRSWRGSLVANFRVRGTPNEAFRFGGAMVPFARPHEQKNEDLAGVLSEGRDAGEGRIADGQRKIEDRVPERREGPRGRRAAPWNFTSALPERLPLLERRPRLPRKSVGADEAEAQDRPDAEVGDRHEQPEGSTGSGWRADHPQAAGPRR